MALHQRKPSALLHSPTAEEEFQMVDYNTISSVKAFFARLSQADVLKFCLGLKNFADAPALAYDTTVICYDTEGWNADSGKLTEVGFNGFSARNTRAVDAGPWGENYLRQANFYHARIAENSHLENRSGTRGDPTKNRFGQTRFLSSEEARVALEEFFAVRTLDGRGICPVVILGHALGGDSIKLKSLLKFDANRLHNVVAEIDTQTIVRDLGYWDDKNQIGLQRLIFNLGFEYRDPHTASNDAAMTLIAAILLVLPKNGFSKEKGIQTVVNETEARSKSDIWQHGSAKYCKRCHSRTHWKCKKAVHCAHCAADRSADIANNHMTEDCISYALENGNSLIARLNADLRRQQAGEARQAQGTDINGSRLRRRMTVGWNAFGTQQSAKSDNLNGQARPRRHTQIRSQPFELRLPLFDYIGGPPEMASSPCPRPNASGLKGPAIKTSRLQPVTAFPSLSGAEAGANERSQPYETFGSPSPPGPVEQPPEPATNANTPPVPAVSPVNFQNTTAPDSSCGVSGTKPDTSEFQIVPRRRTRGQTLVGTLANGLQTARGANRLQTSNMFEALGHIKHDGDKKL